MKVFVSYHLFHLALNNPQYSNGEMYMIWSGWSDPEHPNTQDLYIAHMSSPTHIDSERVLLHSPTPSWQQSMLGSIRAGVNEGPSTLTHGNQTFLIYCACCALQEYLYADKKDFLSRRR
jgi:GH43 family beta-xylosidase